MIRELDGFERFDFDADGAGVKTVYRRGEGPGVGAVGMCFTGRFALSLMMDAEMIAPVLSQPGASCSKSAMGIPAEEWDNAVKRSKDEKIDVLAFRFTGDRLCRRERFATLKDGFGERFRPVEVEGKGHSVLTMDFGSMDAADRARVWKELTEFLNGRLR
ncbi:MAG: hypothetical protein KGJ84_15325 [Elusimicrobia bacterium]|nr:hypothetical protein [Elusimicrobiota bacterium]